MLVRFLLCIVSEIVLSWSVDVIVLSCGLCIAVVCSAVTVVNPR